MARTTPARVGRPPLGAEEIAARVAAYCARYGVTDSPVDGLPPFPAGRRETRQHKEWLALYRLQRRHARRDDGPSAAGGPAASAAAAASRCAACGRAVEPAEAEELQLPGRRRPKTLDGRCAALARAAEAAGPDALAAVARLLWPRRAR